jgi:hypothetical protein
LAPFSVGEHTARRLPDGEYLPLATGGHLLLGHQAVARARYGPGWLWAPVWLLIPAIDLHESRLLRGA